MLFFLQDSNRTSPPPHTQFSRNILISKWSIQFLILCINKELQGSLTEVLNCLIQILQCASQSYIFSVFIKSRLHQCFPDIVSSEQSQESIKHVVKAVSYMISELEFPLHIASHINNKTSNLTHLKVRLTK